MAASKSFNIAGLLSSFTIIPNAKIRETYNGFLEKSELNHPHIFATIATAAALSREGEEYLEQLVDYITDNVKYLENFIAENIPQLKIISPQASYLVFIDFRSLGLSPEELSHFLIHKAGLGLIEGSTFGPEGKGFARMNVGCPRSVLAKALGQLRDACREEYLK